MKKQYRFNEIFKTNRTTTAPRYLPNYNINILILIFEFIVTYFLSCTYIILSTPCDETACGR